MAKTTVKTFKIPGQAEGVTLSGKVKDGWVNANLFTPQSAYAGVPTNVLQEAVAAKSPDGLVSFWLAARNVPATGNVKMLADELLRHADDILK